MACTKGPRSSAPSSTRTRGALPGSASLTTSRPASIFYAQRLDYEVILRLVPKGAGIVDLGCGNGELLSILRDRGYAKLQGVERGVKEVTEAISRGLDVLHADLDEGIATISNRGFDVALLSQTLQPIVAFVLDKIVRVAGRELVSFPNFAHAPLREKFMREGHLPKEEGLNAHDGYNTPKRHFPQPSTSPSSARRAVSASTKPSTSTQSAVLRSRTNRT